MIYPVMTGYICTRIVGSCSRVCLRAHGVARYAPPFFGICLSKSLKTTGIHDCANKLSWVCIVMVGYSIRSWIGLAMVGYSIRSWVSIIMVGYSIRSWVGIVMDWETSQDREKGERSKVQRVPW